MYMENISAMKTLFETAFGCDSGNRGITHLLCRFAISEANPLGDKLSVSLISLFSKLTIIARNHILMKLMASKEKCISQFAGKVTSENL